MSPAKQQGLIIGAASGAVIGGGLGCGIARASYGSVGQDDGLAYEIGCPVGFVGGAIIGGVIGYYLAQAPPPPPPPTRPPPAPPPPTPPPPVSDAILSSGVHFNL